MSAKALADLLLSSRGQEGFNPLQSLASPTTGVPAPPQPPVGDSSQMIAAMLRQQMGRNEAAQERFSNEGRRGTGGLLAGVLNNIAAAQARKTGDEKISDLYRQYFEAQNRENAAAMEAEARAKAAERQQMLADEQRKRRESLQDYGIKKGIDAAYTVPDVPEDKSFDKEGKLRKEFSDATKKFSEQNDAFGRIRASAADPSPAGDLALIFNYMKILDPGSTVREGEFANAQNAGSVPDRIRSTYNSVMEGTRLSAPQRADFLDRSQRLYGEAVESFDRRRNQFIELAESYELDPERVARDRALYREANVSQSPEVGTVQQGYRFKGGDPADPNSWEQI